MIRNATRTEFAFLSVGVWLLSIYGCQPADVVPRSPRVKGVSVASSKLVAAVGSDGLTDAQRRGKQIYTHGKSSRGGAITAMLSQSTDAVPAALLACVNCHGWDGRGRPEGDLDPPDVTWRTICRPVAPGKRRARPGYNGALLGRVITMGLDSGGQHMGVGMPCYQLSVEDLADLISYLEVLGATPDPSVGAEMVLLGSILQEEPSASSLSGAISRVLNAYCADLNARGGLYQRKIKFAYEVFHGDPNQVGTAIGGFLSRRHIFALVAPFVGGFERQALDIASDHGVPVIGPFAASGPEASHPRRFVFYTQSGLGAQARALAAVAADKEPTGVPTIVVGDDPVSAAAADEVAAGWVREGKQVAKLAILRALPMTANWIDLLGIWPRKGQTVLSTLAPLR